MIETTVRCFRRLHNEVCTTRRGIWIMTGPKRGIFFHGDREEAQVPQYTLTELEAMTKEPCPVDGYPDVQEIPPEGALKELQSWPKAVDAAKKAFERHRT